MTLFSHRPRLLRGCALAIVVLLAGMARAADETPTVITSDTADMVSTDAQSTFTFRNNVVVTGTNIKITCHELLVVANRSGDPKATIGKQDKFQSLVATGEVQIVQNDREATCDRAEVFPGEDKVVLTGHPVVRSLDGQYRADGPRLVLYRGQRRAVIEGGPTERTHIALPPLKDLGYQKETESKTSTSQSTSSPTTAPQK